MTLRLFLLDPAVAFTGLVDQASFTYPLGTVDFDNGTELVTVREGMTVIFGSSIYQDDYGRSRVRDASGIGVSGTLGIGRSSQGSRDGEVNLQNNATIVIYDDFRVWAKIPYIAADGTIYKDHNLAVGTLTGDDIPPVANAGVGFAATIDSETEVITASWNASTNSLAVADGASISSYLWDVGDGTITVGSTTTAAITATFPAGFRWVHLTVTDSNANTHACHMPVFARDPASDATISAFSIEGHRITPQGQQISIRIRESIPEVTYPDGTLVMIWEDEPSSAADRTHMRFIGWHHTDPAEMRAVRTGLLADTILECRDVAGKLDALPGFTQEVEGAASPATWTEMKAPNMDKYLHYLLHWHSTALELADWTWSGTGSDYPFVVLGSDGESLFDQVARRAQSLVPNYVLTCNRLGQMAVTVDPMLQDTGDRTATVQATLTEANWTAIRYSRLRPPRIYWHRGNAIIANASTISAVFCIAPGEAPGQGEIEQEHGEQLAMTQTALNSCEGHRYARLNAEESTYVITLASGSNTTIEPANMTWVRLTIGSTTAAQRGLTFTNARGLVQEINIVYAQTRTGLVRTVELIWERETSGTPAVTYVPPPPPDPGDDDWDDGWDWTPPDDPGLGAGQRNIVGVNTDGFQYVTTNFHTSSAAGGPTWARTDLSLSGTVQSFVVDPFSPLYIGTGTTVNYWVATSTNIYYIEDAFGVSAGPTVNDQHTFGTVIPSPEGTRSINASFGNFNSNQAWLICISYYKDEAGHTGTWAIRTQDAGTTWSSEVQLSANYNSGAVLFYVGIYASPKTAGKAYSAAFTATGGPAAADGYLSLDYGATWARISNPDILPGEALSGIFHVPWPDNGTEKIVYYRYVDQGVSFNLKRIESDGTTNTDISPTSGLRTFGPAANNFGLDTFDSNRRFVAVIGRSEDEYFAGFVSADYGNAWTEIITPRADSSMGPRGIAFAHDTEQVLYIWGSEGYMAYSQNFGAAVDDRRGNIPTDYPSIGDFIGIAGGG